MTQHNHSKAVSMQAEAASFAACCAPPIPTSAHKVGLKPGPFDASALKESGADAKSTLITGLLVIYPLVASAGAVLAGLWFLGASGPV